MSKFKNMIFIKDNVLYTSKNQNSNILIYKTIDIAIENI